MAIKRFNAVSGFSVGNDVIIDIVDSNANVIANSLTVSATANLGAVGNVKITGGSLNQVLSTDGAGNLSWVTSGSSSSIISNGTSNVNIPAVNGNVTISSAGNANILVITGTGANIAGTLGVSGTITASAFTANTGVFTGNGSGLTQLAGANVTGTVANATYAVSSGTAGTVTTAAQPNITSVGTLTSLTISGSTTLSGGTANSIAYLNGSKVLTTGSALTFDGTTITSTASVSSAIAVTGKSLLFYNVSTSDALLRAADDSSTVTAIGFNKTDVKFYSNGSEAMRLTSTGLGIGTSSPGYKLEVNGSFAATTKSFVINHPTKPGRRLRHGSLEGPENGVYVRGKLKGTVIELPEYWTKLIDPDSITVQLTPIGKHQKLYVEDIRDNKVYIANDGMFASEPNCFYYILAERIDVDKLDIEVD